MPDTKILEIYDALRRGERRAALEGLATEIEQTYGARLTAAFLREAAALESPPGGPTQFTVVFG